MIAYSRAITSSYLPDASMLLPLKFSFSSKVILGDRGKLPNIFVVLTSKASIYFIVPM